MKGLQSKEKAQMTKGKKKGEVSHTDTLVKSTMEYK